MVKKVKLDKKSKASFWKILNQNTGDIEIKLKADKLIQDQLLIQHNTTIIGNVISDDFTDYPVLTLLKPRAFVGGKVVPEDKLLDNTTNLLVTEDVTLKLSYICLNVVDNISAIKTLLTGFQGRIELDHVLITYDGEFNADIGLSVENLQELLVVHGGTIKIEDSIIDSIHVDDDATLMIANSQIGTLFGKTSGIQGRSKIDNSTLVNVDFRENQHYLINIQTAGKLSFSEASEVNIKHLIITTEPEFLNVTQAGIETIVDPVTDMFYKITKESETSLAVPIISNAGSVLTITNIRIDDETRQNLVALGRMYLLHLLEQNNLNANTTIINTILRTNLPGVSHVHNGELNVINSHLVEEFTAYENIQGSNAAVIVRTDEDELLHLLFD